MPGSDGSIKLWREMSLGGVRAALQALTQHESRISTTGIYSLLAILYQFLVLMFGNFIIPSSGYATSSLNSSTGRSPTKPNPFIFLVCGAIVQRSTPDRRKLSYRKWHHWQ